MKKLFTKTKITIFTALLFLGNALQAQAPCFSPVVNYSVGVSPGAIVTADVNGDGIMDLITANVVSNDVSILIGNGLGGFATAVNFAVGIGAFGITAGDFNGDGKVDLAVANTVSNDVSVLIGNGLGSFVAAVNFISGGIDSKGIVIADFNGDGKMDLATSNRTSSNVSILMGNGLGSFSAPVLFGVGTDPWFIVASDFNGDGKMDLATCNAGSDDVSILIGNGFGSFAAAAIFAVGSSPVSITAGDFNWDGKIDLATANLNSNNVSVLIGNGLGSFVAAVNYASGGLFTSGVIAVDFNFDGNLDLGVTNQMSNNVSVLNGNGIGVFAAPINFGVGVGPLSIIAADFNGDGGSDIACNNIGSGSNHASMLLNCSTPGAALNFDGVNDYVACGNVIPSTYTKEAWIKITNLGLNNNIIGGGIDGQHTIYAPGGMLNSGHNGAWNAVVDPTPLLANTWYHIAVTYDALTTTMKLYKNGVLMSSNSAVPAFTGGNALRIGCVDLGTNVFGGKIDEVRIWNTVRTSCEINTYKNCEIPTTALGLIVNYHFNQGISAGANGAVISLTDFSGSAFTGTLTNFALTGAISNWTGLGGVASSYTVALPAPVITVSSGSICVNDSYTIAPVGGITYSYTPLGPIVTPTANMSYSVTGTSSVGCVSSNTAVSTVTVNASPLISASASSAVICTGEATTLSATASSTTYTWNTGATTASLSVSPTTTTNYTVTTTGTNGCTGTANVNVTVNACTGINEVTASLISVYPNPNNGIVNINLTTALIQNSTLEIYDALGKLVVKQVLSKELNAVNMSNLDNGIYVFKVLNNNNTVKIGKLIKQ